MTKKIKVVFKPGAFDNFEGSQEELDAFVAEIIEGFESGEYLKDTHLEDLDESTELILRVAGTDSSRLLH
jgi:hypothetical protein